jgi:hypothetical protein
MRIRTPAAAVLLALPLAGCLSIKAGNGPGAAVVRMDGPVQAHVSAGPPARSSSAVNVGVLRGTQRDGELVSVDVWPLFGVGVGILGARASILGLEVGVGTLFYDPQPPDADADDAEATEESDESGDPEPESDASDSETD